MQNEREPNQDQLNDNLSEDLFVLSSSPNSNIDDLIKTISSYSKNGWQGMEMGNRQIMAPSELITNLDKAREEAIDLGIKPSRFEFPAELRDILGHRIDTSLPGETYDPMVIFYILDKYNITNKVFQRTSVLLITNELHVLETLGNVRIHKDLKELLQRPISGHACEYLAQYIGNIDDKTWQELQNHEFTLTKEETAREIISIKTNFYDKLNAITDPSKQNRELYTSILADTLTSAKIDKPLLPFLFEAITVDLVNGNNPLGLHKEAPATKEKPVLYSMADLANNMEYFCQNCISKMQFDKGNGDFVESLKTNLKFAENFGLNSIQLTESNESNIEISELIGRIDKCYKEASSFLTEKEILTDDHADAIRKIGYVLHAFKIPTEHSIRSAVEVAIFNTLGHKYAEIDYSKNIEPR
jgi:hypothetical protein